MYENILFIIKVMSVVLFKFENIYKKKQYFKNDSWVGNALDRRHLEQMFGAPWLLP